MIYNNFGLVCQGSILNINSFSEIIAIKARHSTPDRGGDLTRCRLNMIYYLAVRSAPEGITPHYMIGVNRIFLYEVGLMPP